MHIYIRFTGWNTVKPFVKISLSIFLNTSKIKRFALLTIPISHTRRREHAHWPSC